MTAKTKEMELNAALKEIYEIWAGSEGIPLPKTAPEAYLLGLVEQMRDIARDALASASTKPKYLSWQHAKWCASFGIPDDPNAKRPDCDCFMQRMEKIPVDRSVVQQALHVAMAAEHPVKLIAALRAALADGDNLSPTEPVAKVDLMLTGGNAGLATRIVEIDDPLRERLRPGQLLYTAPPQRKPLTEEELWNNDEIMSLNADLGWHMEKIRMFARAIERAHEIGGSNE